MISTITWRCLGAQVPFAKQLDTQCIDCARRLQTEHGEHQVWRTGEVVDGVCLNKIKDES